MEALAAKLCTTTTKRLSTIVYPRFILFSVIQTSANAAAETWFRFLVKQLKIDISSSKPAYEWYEMGFLTYCTAPNETIVLCFDVPDIFRTRLHDTLNFTLWRREDYSISSLHAFLTKETIDLYDDSVWAIRDVVRDIEKVSGSIAAFQNSSRRRLNFDVE